MEKANSTQREAIRTSLLGVRGLKGVEGTYDFGADGDGVHGYNKNDKGKIAFIKHIEFPPPK